MSIKSILLAGSALFVVPTIASAQDAGSAAQAGEQREQPTSSAKQTPPEQEGEASPRTLGEIVVTGERRGSVLGDIPPENVLTGEQVRATGAINISALIERLAPQIGSARGRDDAPPLLLLSGRRISSSREVFDIPTDAISRVEILPEDVALKYGYRADQRVLNIVLKEEFRSNAILIRGSAASEGGYADGTADVTRLTIGDGRRTTINLRAEGNSGLTENERDILVEPHSGGIEGSRAQAARSLIGSKRDLRGTFTHYRQIGDVGATGNLELGRTKGRSLIGLSDTTLNPLARDTAKDSLHAGFVLNGDAAHWHWSVTGNADASRDVTDTDRAATKVRDRGVTDIISGDIDAIANGTLFRVPAGEAGATFRAGASTLHLDSDRRQNGVGTSNALGRTRGHVSIHVDLPVSRRGSGAASLGNLIFNGNAEVERLSDFGTLTAIGAGLYWSPVPRLDLTVNWTREEGAPTVQQLGEPVLETPGTRLFDFTTGETVLVAAITGGNPGLGADHRDVVKFGANWKPFEKTDLRFRADYVRSRLSDPTSSLPAPTPAFEVAFPERFIRNSTGQLVSADLRPVNFESARRDTLRLGFDVSMPLKSAPPSRTTAAKPGLIPERESLLTDPARPESAMTMGQPAPDGGGQPVRTLFSPGDGRHIWFSLTDTITLVDKMTIRNGLKLDYLRGDAVGQTGGRPRHDIEGRAGYSNDGRGAFLSMNWCSGTSVTSATGRNVNFSPLATFDLGLFVNLDPRFKFVSRHPWLEGVSIHLDVRNLFNSKPNVRDPFGNVPLGFQSDLLDSRGRMIGITFRRGGGGIGG